jgi:hypothetical protein
MWSQKATVIEATATAPAIEEGTTVYPDSAGYDPIGIVEGSGGALWYTNTIVPSIGQITTAGKITHYTDPRLTRPFGTAAGSDGALWFTNGGDPGSIGRITTSGTVTEYTYPGSYEPKDITAGPDHSMGTRGIGRVSTLAFTSGPKLSGPSRVGKAGICLFGGLNATASSVAWLVNGAGKAESVTSGTWAPGASSYSYQWYLGSSAIAHATSARYTPPSRDRGKTLHCVVTAHRPGYASGRYATPPVALS